MKKVLVIAPYPYLPFFSGGQKFIARFLEYLAKEVELTVISVATNDASLAKNYRLLPLLKSSFSRYMDTSLIQKITSEVRSGNYDTVIWQHPYYAWLAFRVRKRTGIRTIIHTHNIEYQRFRSLGKWWWPVLKVYEKWCFKKADALFFITPEDKQFAINRWHIKADRCIDLPFGIDISEYPTDRKASKENIALLHGFQPEENLLLFSGLLSYKPNLEALKVILQHINPLLKKKPDFRYKIIICGKDLPPSFNDLKDYAADNIIFAGFVDDIALYYKAADIFLNPVQSGGGIKTKMVEAIGYGATVVSTVSGATGILTDACGEKLVLVKDNEWEAFADATVAAAATEISTSPEYYNNYFWGNFIKRISHPSNS